MGFELELELELAFEAAGVDLLCVIEVGELF